MLGTLQSALDALPLLLSHFTDEVMEVSTLGNLTMVTKLVGVGSGRNVKSMHFINKLFCTVHSKMGMHCTFLVSSGFEHSLLYNSEV